MRCNIGHDFSTTILVGDGAPQTETDVETDVESCVFVFLSEI